MISCSSWGVEIVPRSDVAMNPDQKRWHVRCLDAHSLLPTNGHEQLAWAPITPSLSPHASVVTDTKIYSIHGAISAREIGGACCFACRWPCGRSIGEVHCSPLCRGTPTPLLGAVKSYLVGSKYYKISHARHLHLQQTPLTSYLESFL